MKKTLALTALVAALGCGAASPAEDARNELRHVARVSLETPKYGICGGIATLNMYEDMFSIECDSPMTGAHTQLIRNFTEQNRCDDVLTYTDQNGSYISLIDLGCGGIPDYLEIDTAYTASPPDAMWQEAYSIVTDEMNLEGADLQWRIRNARQRR
ncbi:MAG: hypothetical protein V1734_03825 [Nanoarchaeota archaeon]